jgi:hypothetical protein
MSGRFEQRYWRLNLDELRADLGFSRKQWMSLRGAAADASMELRAYIRLMLLAAAGHGGVIEHANRAADASWDAEARAIEARRTKGEA